MESERKRCGGKNILMTGGIDVVNEEELSLCTEVVAHWHIPIQLNNSNAAYAEGSRPPLENRNIAS